MEDRSRSFALLKMTPIGMERTEARGAIRRGGGWRGEHGEGYHGIGEEVKCFTGNGRISGLNGRFEGSNGEGDQEKLKVERLKGSKVRDCKIKGWTNEVESPHATTSSRCGPGCK